MYFCHRYAVAYSLQNPSTAMLFVGAFLNLICIPCTPKIAYQYEYQIDVKNIEFTPQKRNAVWG